MTSLECADFEKDWNIILLIIGNVKQRYVKYTSPKETLTALIRFVLRKMSCNTDLRCLDCEVVDVNVGSC